MKQNETKAPFVAPIAITITLEDDTRLTLEAKSVKPNEVLHHGHTPICTVNLIRGEVAEVMVSGKGQYSLMWERSVSEYGWLLADVTLDQAKVIANSVVPRQLRCLCEQS